MKSKILLLAAFLTAPASGASLIAYDNLGPGGAYSLGGGFPLQNYIIAETFTAATSGFLSDIIVALEMNGSASGDSFLNVYFWADNGGTPGTLLEEIANFDGGSYQQNGQLVTAPSSLHPYLVSGQSYWVGIQAVDPSHHAIGWWDGDVLPDYGEAYSLNGTWGPVSPTPTVPSSLEVVLTPSVPEPSSLLLACAAAALAWCQGLLAFQGWRKPGGQPVSVESVSPPERPGSY